MASGWRNGTVVRGDWRVISTLVLVTGSVASQPAAPPASAPVSVEGSACPDNTPAVFHPCALAAAEAFDPPRTPGGVPDLSGVWRLPGNAFEDLEDHPATLDDNGNPAIVVDPPDGKVPMQSWSDARRRRHYREHIHPAAACFLSGVPYLMYRPAVYQFLQTPEYFVILGERAHGYRIVHFGDAAPLGEKIRLWNGDSRAHWDGDTLVIETTNQNAEAWIDQRGRFYTEEASVVERLRLIEPNTLHYQATIEDPNVYTRPFTIALAYRRNTVEGRELVEEACYENNEALLEIYRGLGLTIYTGITSEAAREAMEAGE